MNPRIICGFPGIGKSHLAKHNDWQDSDSSQFSWISPGVRNPDFPHNYVQHIQTSGKNHLVSTHKAVRDEFAKQNIPFVLCYPERQCKEEYIQRYRQRGSTPAFLQLLSEKWDEWITEMENESRAAQHLVLQPGQFASDVL